jgi:Tfp pilus assembly pilus retraction ATPase PilT
MKTIAVSTRIPVNVAVKLFKRDESISYSKAIRLAVEEYVKSLDGPDVTLQESIEYLFNRSKSLIQQGDGVDQKLLRDALDKLGID